MLINNGKSCRKCSEIKPLSSFYVSKTIKSGKPVYFSYCKRCVNAREKVKREKKKASIKDRVVELLLKSRPMTSKEISDCLEAYYKSVAMICSFLRRNGLILCVTYKGDMPVYSAPQIKKQERDLEKGITQAEEKGITQAEEKGITKDDLDYQAYYLLPRHIRRNMTPPVIDSVVAADMQSIRFAFGQDYAVKTNGSGPW